MKHEAGAAIDQRRVGRGDQDVRDRRVSEQRLQGGCAAPQARRPRLPPPGRKLQTTAAADGDRGDTRPRARGRPPGFAVLFAGAPVVRKQPDVACVLAEAAGLAGGRAVGEVIVVHVERSAGERGGGRRGGGGRRRRNRARGPRRARGQPQLFFIFAGRRILVLVLVLVLVDRQPRRGGSGSRRGRRGRRQVARGAGRHSTCRRRRIAEVGEAGRRAARPFDADQEVADVDAIGRSDRRGPRDLAPVDVGAVRALEIGDLHLAGPHRQPRMPLRDVPLGEHDVIAGDAPNRDSSLSNVRTFGSPPFSVRVSLIIGNPG